MEQQEHQYDTEQPVPSVFDESVEFKRIKYHSGVKIIRQLLFVLGISTVIIETILMVRNNYTPSTALTATISADTVICISFIALSLWVKAKPYTALQTAIIIFLAVQIALFVVNPSAKLLSHMWIFKFTTLFILISYLKNARTIQAI